MNGHPIELAAGTKVDGTGLGVLLFFFIIVTVGGFWAARWRRSDTPHSLTNGAWAVARSAP